MPNFPDDLEKILAAVASGALSPSAAAGRLRSGEVRSLPGVRVRSAGRALVVGSGEPPPSGGRVGAISAGTSDVPALEEAVAVVREMGAEVRSFYDVGVAGIHRLAA